MLLPGFTVQVIDSTDAQFQHVVTEIGSIDMLNDEPDTNTWSFDDKCRYINHLRKYGIDLFAIPNKNNSTEEQKQFGNNSETELIGELFEGHEAARQALATTIGNPTSTELRDDIDQLIEELEKSSSSEQKEFGND